jgi:hypothetical protein
MTTLAKIEANRRNGELSTGPRTVEGKVVVARNATKHGIFASVPVIPGENPEAWEAHRAGVVGSLAPVGLLEVNLAERAALLLWRLQRLARYEAETIAAEFVEVEAIVVPSLPPPEDLDNILDDSPEQKTRDEQLRDIRRELRNTRQELADVTPAREFFCCGGMPTDQPIPFGVAESILETACEIAETDDNLRADPPAFDSKRFLRKLGLSDSNPESVTWTQELIERGIAHYASYGSYSPERFRESVRVELDESVEELTRKVRRLERDEAAVLWLLDDRKPPKQAKQLLPSNGRDERIAKYERHLHNLLTSTLHELERLQARREGEAIPPPAVADVTVTVESVSE